jgi:hypothetical protein
MMMDVANEENDNDENKSNSNEEEEDDEGGDFLSQIYHSSIASLSSEV